MRFQRMATVAAGVAMMCVMMTACSKEDNAATAVDEDAVPSVGQSQQKSGNWTFTDYGSYIILNGYTGSDKATLTVLTMPNHFLDGKPVVGLAWDFRLSDFPCLETLNFYYDCAYDDMPSVMNCSKLAHVNCINNDGTTRVTDYLPRDMRTIRSYFFQGTAITSLNLNQVTTVRGGAFRYCNALQSLTVAAKTNIESQAFSYIPGECIIYSGDSLKYWSYQQIAFSPNLYVDCKDGAIGWCGGSTSVDSRVYWTIKGSELKFDCEADRFYEAPSLQTIKTRRWNSYITAKKVRILKLVLSNVYAIGDSEFKDFVISDLTLNEGLTSIGALAFAECYELTHVTIPASVTSIGTQAFRGCKNLKTVTILGHPTIGADAFPQTTTVTYANQ